MKHNIFFMFIQLIFTISSGSSIDLNMFPSTTIGPYRMVFKQVYNCNPTQNNKIQHNMHIIQKDNITLLLGNTTQAIPFDDTLSLEIKIAFKDSSGIWKQNLFMHTSPNACSTLKNVMGKAWPEMIHGYGFPNVNCPLTPGVHISPGLNMSIFKKANFPKAVFYGTYKFKLFFTRKDEHFGCQIFIFDVKRP